MAQTAETTPLPNLLDTGVPNLDLVLGGGLQQHNTYLIAGSTGAGKSVLNRQIVFHRARQGDRVLLLTGLDEPHHNLLEHLQRLRFADLSLIGPRIETVSLVPFLQQPLTAKMDVLRGTVLNVRPQLVSIEGLRSLQAFLEGEQELAQFLYGLTSWFALEGITLLLTMTTSIAPRDEPEFRLVDGVLFLQQMTIARNSRRRLWVLKARGQCPLRGPHAFTIDADGLSIWPRPQSLLPEGGIAPSPGHASTGIAGLDALLGGGFPASGATLAAGATASGVTALALSFLSEGARRQEHGLWLGFGISPSRLLASSGIYTQPLAKDVEAGRSFLLARPPYEVDPDPLAWELQRRVEDLGCRRLVLHGTELLAEAFASAKEATAFVAWLVQWTTQRGIALLVTAEDEPGIYQPAGWLVPRSLFEEQVVFERIWEDGAWRNTVSASGASIPGYQTARHWFDIDENGPRLGEPVRALRTEPV